MAYTLPDLPYAYNALEPYIDEETMHYHHDKHHQTYVNNLNGAVEKHPELFNKSAEELITDLAAIPEDIRGAVRNNGGDHANHSLFWQIMGPDGGHLNGPVQEAVRKTFGSEEDFKKLYPEQVKNFFFNQLEYDPSSFGGESFLEVRERVIRGLNKFIELNKNYERVLVVSHGATLKTLLHYISGKDISTLSDEAIPKNTSYTIVKYENGKFEIIDFSNTSHLEEKL